jgi:hypothetical protein
MRSAIHTQAEDIAPFLAAVLRELNARTLPKPKLAYARSAARQAEHFAERRPPMMLDALMSSDAVALNMPAFWSDYWTRERERLNTLFRELAARGKLSSDDWQEQRENFARGNPATTVSMRGAQPVLDSIPRFDATDPTAVLDAKVAYALIRLSAPTVAGLRVLQCKHCGDLFLATRGKTAGRPRSEFCKYAHSNAYAQAQTRLRNKKREAAARHK